MKLKEEDKKLLENIFEKKKDIRIVSDKEFEYFKERVFYWQKYLGLTEYTIYVENLECKGGFAQTWITETGQNAYIRLTTEVKKDDESGFDLDDTALHEVLEVMLWDLRAYAEYYVARDIVDKEIHKIIARFINLFIYNKRG